MPKPEWGFGIFALQGLAMAFDEFHFHRKRGLPRWERIGHPLDTLTVLLCLLLVLFSAPSERSLKFYIGLSAFSCLSITKDELVHARLCSGAEHWLHSVLFILHPLAFLAAAWLWPVIHSGNAGFRLAFGLQIVLIALFLVFQVVYWICRKPRPRQ